MKLQFMQKLTFLFVSFLLLSTSSGLIAEVSGQAIGYACSGCHGTDGLLQKPGMPKLKSLPTEEMFETLIGFKNGTKKSSIMGRIAKGFSDEELKAVAVYFNQLK